MQKFKHLIKKIKENYFYILTLLLFILLPISHDSIEIIRYIFIALILTNIKILKKACNSKGTIALLLFLFIAILSNFLNNTSLSQIDRPINWTIAYLIGYLSIIHNSNQKIIPASLFCLSTVLILHFFYDLWTHHIYIRYDGGLTSPNQFAIILLAPLYFFFFHSLEIYKKNISSSLTLILKLIFYLVIFCILYIIFIKTGARTTVILNTIILVIILFYYSTQKKIWVPLFIFTIFLTIIIFFKPQYKQRFIHSIKHLKQDLSFLERFPIWYSAIQCIQEKPLLGGGFNSFRKCYKEHHIDFFKKHPKFPHINNTNNAHNFFLHILTETGIIGLSIIIFLFAYAIRYGLKQQEYLYLPFILLGSLCGFMMNMNFYIREISTLLMIIIGWIFANYENRDIKQNV